MSEVTLHGVAHGGEAVGRVGDMVAFVDYALPGERVALEISERKPRYLRGRVTEVLAVSPDRVAAPCPIFGICGGCHWQHASYQAQLRFKTQVLRDQLVRVGKFNDPPVEAPVSSPLEWYYRNAVQLVPAMLDEHGVPIVSRRAGAGVRRPDQRVPTEQSLPSAQPVRPVPVRPERGGARSLCFQRARSHAPVAVERCYISDPLINQAIEGGPWHALSDAAWRSLEGVSLRVVPERALQMTLLGGRRLPTEEARDFVRAARRALPDLAGVLHARDRSGEAEIIWGDPALVYDLAGCSLEVPAGAFFQVNGGAAQRLVELVLAWLDPQPADAVLDVYAGVGTFTLPLAHRVTSVQAVEAHGTAASAAIRNAAMNDLTNVLVHGAPAEAVLPRLSGPVDLVLLDPPRRGCSPEVLAGATGLGARKIAYVSCEPSTLARDLRWLADAGYRLARAGVVDLFPQTYHLESISLLEKR